MKTAAVMRAVDWRPITSGSLRGFFDLQLASGIRIHDCMLHERDGSRWVGLPGKAQIDADGRQRIDPATGKRAYTPVVTIPSSEIREKFRSAALEAVDRLLGQQQGG
jgi:hypothetical protein